MNQVQKNYIRKRVEGILNRKLSNLRTKLTVAPKLLNNQERIRLIKSGKVKMKSQRELDEIRGTFQLSINTVFDFSQFENKGGTDHKLYQKKSAILQTEANKINDKIMLGDSEEAAIKLIRAFENFDI